MGNKIVVIGISHKYQIPNNPDADAFETLIGSILDSSDFKAIAEEMSREALTQKNASQSICEIVANGRGVVHIYCDPDNAKRLELKIRSENEIRSDGFLQSRPEDEIDQEVQNSHDRREQYWLSQIFGIACTPILAVIGANHVNSFGEKLVTQRIAFEVLDSDWRPQIT